MSVNENADRYSPYIAGDTLAVRIGPELSLHLANNQMGAKSPTKHNMSDQRKRTSRHALPARLPGRRVHSRYTSLFPIPRSRAARFKASFSLNPSFISRVTSAGIDSSAFAAQMRVKPLIHARIQAARVFLRSVLMCARRGLRDWVATEHAGVG
jgi:hypothetical protein